MADLHTPYPGEGMWLRGNLHAHTTNSDGVRSPGDVVDDYEARGYDFLALSDHNVATDPAPFADRDAITLLPGAELSANGPHLLHLGPPGAVEADPDRRSVVDRIQTAGGLAIPAHPNWKAEFSHWSIEALASLDGIHGIEIYNGLVEHHPGAALATDRWDQLLSAGHRVWGFANDDSHRPWEVARGWNVVRAPDASPESILAALAAGAFYASTGVTVTEIDATDGVLSVETTNADLIRLVSDHGVVQQTVADRNARFRIPDQLVYRSDHTYVRVECLGRGGAMAWLQPMVVT